MNCLGCVPVWLFAERAEAFAPTIVQEILSYGIKMSLFLDTGRFVVFG